MQTVKIGSKGTDVTRLQQLLHIGADGVFGKKTEQAVKAFQVNNGLYPDGICGQKTWSMLMGDLVSQKSDAKCVDTSVIYDPLNVHITHKANRTIKYLAIHFTAGSRSTKGVARNVKAVFETRKASADFCVDDVEMRQFNPDLKNNYCWAVGDKKDTTTGGGKLYGIATNSNTISIEICSTHSKGSLDYSNHEGWSFTEAALNNAVKLAKLLMKKYGISIDRVVRHYDVSGKLCPGLIGWNDGPLKDTTGRKIGKNNSEIWQEFLQRLS